MSRAQAGLVFVLVAVFSVAAAVWTAPILQGWIDDLEAYRAGAPGAPASASASADGAAGDGAAPAEPPEGTRVPRPAVGAPTTPGPSDGGSPAPVPVTVVGADAGERDGATEDSGAAFGQVDPDRPFVRAELDRTLQELVPGMTACLEAWAGTVDAFSGRVDLRFVVEPTGLTDVSILDPVDVPAPILGCISAPVWEATWPAPSAREEVEFPFVVELEAASPEAPLPPEGD